MARRVETLENHYPVIKGQPRCLWRFRKVQQDARRRLQSVMTPHASLQVEPVMELAEGAAVLAYINHNRWFVACPCENRQFSSPQDPRFFCDHCFNVGVGNRLLAVVFPENLQEIERELERRPYDHQRNWIHGVPVEFLRAENAERGFPEWR